MGTRPFPNTWRWRRAGGALAAVWLACSAVLAPARAQSTDAQIERYRDMLADDNPAELYEADGEALWKRRDGPRQASLERCDLGLGPGVVKGAAASLPRYFSDTGRVQDLESRLLTCMETLQGMPAAEVAATPFGQGRMKSLTAIATWISGQSRGMPIDVRIDHPEARRVYALGQRLFYYRGGPMDFACASCHGENGKRIRLQALPNLATQAGAAEAWGSWPAYRISNGEMWTMQHRLNDCFRQQRFPAPVFASEVTIALSLFLAANASGGKMATPGLKR